MVRVNFIGNASSPQGRRPDVAGAFSVVRDYGDGTCEVEVPEADPVTLPELLVRLKGRGVL